MSSSDTVMRSVLADQVKQWLLDAILHGTYPPDSRIVETAVAKELGTSQAPVREALRGLEALGIVEIAPFRGARVRRIEASDLLEAYVVRSTIEELGARLAMARLTDEDIAGLLAIGVEMQEAADADDGRTLAIVDASLHERLMQLSGNATLLRVWRSLEPISRTYITLAGPGSDPRWTCALHDPILEAVRDRDPDGVVRALTSHFEQIRERLAEHLGEVVEQQTAGVDEEETA